MYIVPVIQDLFPRFKIPNWVWDATQTVRRDMYLVGKEVLSVIPSSKNSGT